MNQPIWVPEPGPQRNNEAATSVLLSTQSIPINSEEHAMADDLKDRGAQDRSRISMHEEHEVRYWTKALGVSKEELASAVAKAATPPTRSGVSSANRGRS